MSSESRAAHLRRPSTHRVLSPLTPISPANLSSSSPKLQSPPPPRDYLHPNANNNNIASPAGGNNSDSDAPKFRKTFIEPDTLDPFDPPISDNNNHFTHQDPHPSSYPNRNRSSLDLDPRSPPQLQPDPFSGQTMASKSGIDSPHTPVQPHSSPKSNNNNGNNNNNSNPSLQHQRTHSYHQSVHQPSTPVRKLSPPPRPSAKQHDRPPTNHHHQNRRRAIGDWEFIKTIGAGSMGKVKLAKHRFTGEQGAVKIVPKAAISASKENGKSEADEAKDIRTIREAAIVSLLDHPYICKLKEMSVMTSHYYMVFEYVDGGQMLDYIISHGRLKEKQARKFARQIASALDYCHRNSIVHRDLKIENILISKSGDIKIIDFGLSNLFSPKSLLKTFCGSLYFAAPELLNAKPYLGPEVDIWSFGVVLYVLVCGKVPFDDQSMPALHAKIKRGVVEYPAWLSAECKSLLSRILVVDNKQRAGMAEILNHPWMLRGYEGPPDNFLPPRKPISLPLNPVAIEGMTGFDFGDEQSIEDKMIYIIESPEYQEAVKHWESLHSTHPPRSAGPERKLSFSFYKRKLTGDSNDSADHPIPDPTVAYHPLLSIYYLVSEHLKKIKTSEKTTSSEATLTQLLHPIHIGEYPSRGTGPITSLPPSSPTNIPTSAQSKLPPLKIPDAAAPAHLHAGGGGYEPLPPSTAVEVRAPRFGVTAPRPAVRARARTQGTVDFQNQNVAERFGTDVQASPQQQQQQQHQHQASQHQPFADQEHLIPMPHSAVTPRKESITGSIFRRLSGRRRSTKGGHVSEVVPPVPPVSFSSGNKKSIDLEAQRPGTPTGTGEGGGYFSSKRQQQAEKSPRSLLARSNSVSENRYRQQQMYDTRVGADASWSVPDKASENRRATASSAAVAPSSVIKTPPRYTGATGRIRETPGHGDLPDNVPEDEEEDDEESAVVGNYYDGSGHGEKGAAIKHTRPVFLKGLFSVQTTSTKSPAFIRGDLIRVFDILKIHYKEIEGGFVCSWVRHLHPETSISENNNGGDANAQSPGVNLNAQSWLKFPLSRSSTRGGGQPHPMKRSGSTAQGADDDQSDSSNDDSVWQLNSSMHNMHSSAYGVDQDQHQRKTNSHAVRFEIYIVKLPMLALHGVQFKKLSGNTWEFKSLAGDILSSLKL